MIYLDSSALLKLLFEEQESPALTRWVAEHAGAPLLSSGLTRVEVVRATRRLDPNVLPAARSLLAGIDVLLLAGPVLDEAAEVDGPRLRTLDALHLASALSVRSDLTAFVAYDRRLLMAASDVGLDPLSPGA